MARFLGHVLGRLVTPLGFDGTDFRNVAVDADGHVQVSVVSDCESEGSQDGTLEGITEETVVDAPIADVTRRVLGVNIWNADTAAVTVLLWLRHGEADRFLCQATLQVGEALNFEFPVVLDAPDKSLVARNGSAPATTGPHYVSSYRDSKA